MNINNQDNDDEIKFNRNHHIDHDENNNFKIKGYSGISFLYSNWTFSFLLVVQLVAIGFFAQGLTIFFEYGNVYDWRIPLLWGGAVFSTLICIFLSMALLANNFNLIKIGLLSIIVSLIITLLEIALLVVSKNQTIKELEHCSELQIASSTCIPILDQMFCGTYLKYQCEITYYGFKKLLLSQAAITLVDAFLIGFTLLKLQREEKRKKNNYQLLSSSEN